MKKLTLTTVLLNVGYPIARLFTLTKSMCPAPQRRSGLSHFHQD